MRALADLEAVVPLVAAFEPAMRDRSDAELRAVTDRLRQRVRAGARLEDVLPEGFAAVREAARRSVGLRHRDVQVMAGAAASGGMVAEMADGEGKTLAAALPAYVGALAGQGVHVITLTAELARGDANRMAPVYQALGLEVGVLPDEPADGNVRRADKPARRMAYQADVTYGGCDEFAFDHLRDGLAPSPTDEVQRGHAMAIVDDADVLLVETSLTPNVVAARASTDDERVLARVSRRGYLRIYERLCGLSANVRSAEAALERWFGLDLMQIPPHRASKRIDHPDELYFDVEDQLSAVVRLVVDRHARGQPILVYTPGRHQVEAVARRLHQHGIEHVVLDGTAPDLATAERQMAEVGRWGRVSLLQRLPRAADVPLGGVDPDERQKVIDAGGLLVVGLYRHDFARRNDERLCELAGRRGEPGESRFLLLIGDEDLLQEPGDDPDEARHAFRALMEEGDDSPISGVTELIAMTQWAAEAEWITAWDPLIEHDDLANDRSSAYRAARHWTLHASTAELDDELARLCHSVAAAVVQQRCPAEDKPARWDLDGIFLDQSQIAGQSTSRRKQLKEMRASSGDRSRLVQLVADAFGRAAEARRADLGPPVFAQAVRGVALRILDRHWEAELRRLADEKARLQALPEAERAPAVAATRWAAPPDIDLRHELVARDLLMYVLHTEVRSRQRPASQPLTGQPGDGPLTDIVVRNVEVFGSEADDLVRDIVGLGGQGFLETPPLDLASLDPRVHTGVDLEHLVRQLTALRDRLRRRAQRRT